MTIGFSEFSAVAELFVTAGVFYVVGSNLKGQTFKWKLALGIIIFEFGVNMLYMVSRMQQGVTVALSPGMKAFAALHGSLSLLVFIMFAVYSCLAFFDAKKGNHYFRSHPIHTTIFLLLWTVSVVSGEVMYFYLYT